MQRRTSIQISTFITLLGILTVLIQFAAYYFINQFLIIWGISFLVSMICCHILLEQTTTYEACFNYSLFTLFVSLIINAVTYFGELQSFLPYTMPMLGIAVINWLIPMFHCYLRYMLDYGTKIEAFHGFYRNQSIVFAILYLAALLVGAFITDSFQWAYPLESGSRNFMPFGVLSTLIEDYLYDYIPLSDIVIYLVTRITIYIPYGFYITLLLRRQSRLARFLALLPLPALIEILQYFLVPRHCDIDDLIYAIIGGILGSVLFYLLGLIFRSVSGKEFLAKEHEYRYFNNSTFY